MIKDELHVISASYGNDSMAVIQQAHERGLQNVTVAYCDTGWAAPGWEKRVAEGESLAARHGFAFVQISSMGMNALVKMKGGFPAHGMQFCTMWLKGIPFLEWIDGIDPDARAIVLIGKRRDESPDRADTPEWVDSSAYHGGRKVWHPLAYVTEVERNELLARAGVKVLEHRSDECSPCVNANRFDLRRLGKFQRDRLSALETEVGQPMFRAEKHAGAQGIEQVVKWANYSPGKYKKGQDDLFVEDCGSPFGCGL